MTTTPWPARIGLRCRDVTHELDPRIYPIQGLGRDEVVVLIEDDPLNHDAAERGWSCALDRRHLQLNDQVEHDEGGSGCCARGYCGPDRQAQVLARLDGCPANADRMCRPDYQNAVCFDCGLPAGIHRPEGAR